AGDGGLYAELIKNRDFEGNNLPEGTFREGEFVRTAQGWKHYYPQPDSLDGWNLIVPQDAQATTILTNIKPLNPRNPQSMILSVKKLGSKPVLVTNSGYWGIAVTKDEKYNVSFYARANGYKGAVRVSLRDENSNVLAESELSGFGGNWTKFETSMVATATSTQAIFAIEPLATGELAFDIVSMFPEHTFNNRPNGARKDIAQLLDAATPGFLRFPGGCIVEGVTLQNRFQWKNTIGDIAQRPGRWILWDYHSNEGLGFHEYLQFCEDLKCPAMYVFSVGMSCQFRKCENVQATELQPYIDDVLDALEYALGPVESKWGAMRAANGHAAPFDIKYLEIGNENYGPIYQEHYNYFYKALKAKYPKLTMIACTDPGMREPFKREDLPGITENIEMIDEHFYESPDFFYKNATRYDSYDRKGPKIYMGEFAVKKWDNSLKGNLDASLAEAAFLTGLERNADIVELASFAPTLVHENDRTWNPDMIGYDNYRSFGNPTYQIFRMFSNNKPDYVLPVTNSFDNTQVVTPDMGLGMIGFNNFGADCVYDQVSVTLNGEKIPQAELLTDQTLANRKTDGWEVGKSDFLELKMKPEIYKKVKDQKWTDYTLTLKARANAIDDLEGFSILYYTVGEGTHYKWNIGRWQRFYWMQWYDNGYESYFAQAKGSIGAGKWYDIKLEVKGDSVSAFLDGKLIHKAAHPKKVVPQVYASAGGTDNGEIIVKVVNATEIPKTSVVRLKGVTSVENVAKVYTLTHTDRLAENSVANPENVAPKESSFNKASSEFEYTFEPRSVTVIRIKKK
ncbi:MAG: hypothetical protein RIS47_579, partial [Bacteroidota bacterium]